MGLLGAASARQVLDVVASSRFSSPDAISVNIPPPAGTQAGDFLVCILVTSQAFPPPTVPAGWTRNFVSEELQNQTGQNRITFSSIYLTDAPAATYTFTRTNQTHNWLTLMLTIRGDGRTISVGTTAGSDVDIAATSIDAPSITTGRADSLLINAYGVQADTTFTFPGTVTEVDQYFDSAIGTARTVGVVKSFPPTGATGTRTATIAASGIPAAISVEVRYP